MSGAASDFLDDGLLKALIGLARAHPQLLFCWLLRPVPTTCLLPEAMSSETQRDDEEDDDDDDVSMNPPKIPPHRRLLCLPCEEDLMGLGSR